jgi:hypothetical protein
MIHTRKFSVIKVLLIKVLPIILILGAVIQCSAQGIKISSYMEATYSTPKLGTSATILLPGYMGDYEIGGFYQKKLDVIINDVNTKQIENTLYGFQVGAEFLHMRRFNVNFSIRVGLTDQSLLIILPSLGAEYMLTSIIGVGAGVSYRNFVPAFTGKLFIKTYDMDRFKKEEVYRQKRMYNYK